MENLEQFLIKSNNVSTETQKTHFEASTKEKGKGTSTQNNQAVTADLLVQKRDGNNPMPTNTRVGKAMVCGSQSTIVLISMVNLFNMYKEEGSGIVLNEHA